MTTMMDVSTDNRTNILQSKMEDINKNILNSLSEENAALQKEESELQLLHNDNNKVSSLEQREVDATDAINHIQTETSDKYKRQISDCTVHISNIAATTAAASATSSNDQQDNSLALTGLTSYDNTIRRGRLNSSDDTTTTSSDTCISLNPEVSSHMSTLTPASPLTISASTFNDSAISNISIDKHDGVVSYDDLVLSMMRNEEPVMALKEGEAEQKKVVTVTNTKQSGEFLKVCISCVSFSCIIMIVSFFLMYMHVIYFFLMCACPYDVSYLPISCSLSLFTFNKNRRETSSTSKETAKEQLSQRGEFPWEP